MADELEKKSENDEAQLRDNSLMLHPDESLRHSDDKIISEDLEAKFKKIKILLNTVDTVSIVFKKNRNI